MSEIKNKIISFRDLEIYQQSYRAMIIVNQKVLPILPSSEKHDLISQRSRSTKAIPRLIAEGYAKKHQKAGFQKYLDDVMAECNETIVSLEQARDLYNIEKKICEELIREYDIIVRKTYKLAEAWNGFKRPERKPTNNSAV